MDVTLSKRAKITILVVCLILAAPIYLLSESGMDRQINGLWERAEDTKTPDRLFFLAQIYNFTWREEKAQPIFMEWLKHYGGDQTDLLPAQRYQSWDGGKDVHPWNEDNPRPQQKGENWRKDPHPLTGKVLLYWALQLERARQYQQSAHLYEILADDKNPRYTNIPRDPDVLKQAQLALQRNTSGNRSF